MKFKNFIIRSSLYFVTALLVVACGGGNSSTSSSVPNITQEPKSVSVFEGDLATFTVTASGSDGSTYQWRQNGLNIDGATNSEYGFVTTLADHGKQFSVVIKNSHGSVASSNAELAVLPADVYIISSPVDQTVSEGSSATFSVTAGGRPDFSYQWIKNDTDIPDATAESYTTPLTVITDNGAKFSVRITNGTSSTISEPAVLTIEGVSPSISVQPTNQVIGLNQQALFTVTATGRSELRYQWRKNGINILGATSASFTSPAAKSSDHNTRFSVTVTNEYGAVTSEDALLQISGGVNAASTCSVSNTSSANEPLFTYLWHIKNSNKYFSSNNPAAGKGMDLCMGDLWSTGIVGQGVKVNIVDTGLEIRHEDLSANVMAKKSYNFLTETTDPTDTETTEGDHGTSVAGLIAATSSNSKGGAGVAPKASLFAYNFLSSDQSYLDEAITFGANPLYSAIDSDIFNFSAGLTSDILTYPKFYQTFIMENITKLRSGKGAIFIKSAGNSFQELTGEEDGTAPCQLSKVSCQNANQDYFNTAYNALVIAALAADGTKSSYSTTGSAIWVSGFGGEYGNDSAVVGTDYPAAAYKPALLTTDQSGCTKGYSRSGEKSNALDKGDGTGLNNTRCNYTAIFNGTSSAAPTVSGVVALMLQANPALTWRDVRHILATTSRRVNPKQAAITNTTYFPGTTFMLEQGWVQNQAGFWYHNWYGFGLVNAAAAVAMAQTHTAGSLGTFVSETKTAPLADTGINYGASGLTKTFAIAGTTPSTVEQAELTLHFGAGYRPMCQQIELTSPQGTKSIVLNMDSAHTGASTAGVRFMSNAFYGEKAAGNWTLRFINSCEETQNLSATVAQQLTIRGR